MALHGTELEGLIMLPFLIALVPITLIGLWLVLAVLVDKEIRSPRRWRQTLRRLPHAATWAVLFFALVCGALALWLGWIGFSEQTKEELYVNLATSLGSIAITVLVIDQLNRWRMVAERKREIIEQMGSPVNDAALEAVRLARKHGWLTDGSLKKANFSGANLKGADLDKANFEGASLMSANLEGANLWGANLGGTNLMHTNFEGANLEEANLKDARFVFTTLWRANLGGADLEGTHLGGSRSRNAFYDSRTVFPIGFNPEAAGFIAVAHPDD